MKKLFLFTAALTFAIGLSACSAKSDQTVEKKTTKKTAETTQTDVKKPLVKLYMDLGKKINEKDLDLNAYENAPNASLQAKASDSAASVAAEIKNIQIPKELSAQKDAINAALTDLADSYQAKADELKKPKPNLDAANATFAKGDDELGNVFESVKLLKPTLAKQVD
ncbi:MAG: hypothetical protein Q8934_08420 [Bacillota bacterium]|nr:hypothetical protein [Bacillota bacterium]